MSVYQRWQAKAWITRSGKQRNRASCFFATAYSDARIGRMGADRRRQRDAARQFHRRGHPVKPAR